MDLGCLLHSKEQENVFHSWAEIWAKNFKTVLVCFLLLWYMQLGIEEFVWLILLGHSPSFKDVKAVAQDKDRKQAGLLAWSVTSSQWTHNSRNHGGTLLAGCLILSSASFIMHRRTTCPGKDTTHSGQGILRLIKNGNFSSQTNTDNELNWDTFFSR